MKKTIKIPYGLKNGEITHISTVPSGQNCGCTCISCGTALVARKGEKRVHHFAHSNDSACAETVLHKLGKLFLKQRIDQSIQSQEPLRFRWKCAYCDEQHEEKLTEKAVRCTEETALENTRADLALFDAEERLFAALEIVVTHKPEDSTCDTYKQKNVICIEYHLKTEADLEALKSSPVLTPHRVAYCIMPRCPDCRSFLRQRSVHVVDASCWSCSAAMKIAFGQNGWSMISPDEFVQPEIEAAKAVGALLEQRYSQTVKRRYLANVCGSCNKITGSHFLHDFWHLSENIPPIHAAMSCPECEATVGNAVGNGGTKWIQRRAPEVEEHVEQPEATESPPQLRRPRSIGSAVNIPSNAASPKLPPTPAPSRWGTCKRCGKPACPTVLDESGYFFCFSCGSRALFIAEPNP